MNETDEAFKNGDILRANPYTGRGIILGCTTTHIVQVYWISGRSEGSRNRHLCKDKSGLVWTEVSTPAKEKGDPKLTLYNAMTEGPGKYIVSNGYQTDIVAENLNNGGKHVPGSILEALSQETYEPDKPNFTSRITGVCSTTGGGITFEFAVLRKARGSEDCDRLWYQYRDIKTGFGRCLTTYSDNAPTGERLPPVHGEPLLIAIPQDVDSIINEFGANLNGDNHVSIAVKMIEPWTGAPSQVKIQNRYEKMTAEVSR